MAAVNVNNFNGADTLQSVVTTKRADTSAAASLPLVAVTPVILNVYPPANTIINATQSLAFDITVDDGLGFRNIIVWVEYADQSATELVYADNAYSYNFTGTVQDIAFGKRFTFRRTGGFKAAPTMKIQAVTFSGGVN